MKFVVNLSKELETELIIEAPSREAVDIYAEYLAETFDDWNYLSEAGVLKYVNEYTGQRPADGKVDAEGEEVYD